MGRQKTAPGNPLSIRISEKLLAKLDKAKAELDLSLHDTMREAMKIGLADLESIGYDTAGAVVQQAKNINTRVVEIAMVAEDPAHYNIHPKRAKP